MTAGTFGISKDNLDIFERLKTDFRYFCKMCIKIFDKDGNLVPLIWNAAQEYLWQQLEKMWNDLGYIRMIGIKGRQQGFSTLIEAFGLWKTVFTPGYRVSIVAHKMESTGYLFDKVDLMYRMLPDALKHEERAANAKQKKFANESAYTVVTAGSAEAGRGDNAQFQHRSEVGFFDNPGGVKTGVGRIVSKLKGTIIVQESTANGLNDLYHDVGLAKKGMGVYRIVFVPWFWQQEYRAEVPEGFIRTDEEEFLATWHGVDNEQLQFRRDTIIELSVDGMDGEKRFKQEYPFTLDEAFQSSGDNFFDAQDVNKARVSKLKPEDFMPRIIGCDPGRERDRTVLAFRQGRVFFRDFEIYGKMDTMRLARILINHIEENAIDRVFLDYGMGVGTYDAMRELGYGKFVTLVDFGSGASSARFANKRTEMYFELNKWLKDKGGVSLPDNDDMAMDLNAIPMYKESSTGVLSFPSKDEIRKVLKRSTDIADSMVLTFAYPVRSQQIYDERQERSERKQQITQKSSLSGRRRVESLRRADPREIRPGRMAA
jgi:hypothetical protein